MLTNFREALAYLPRALQIGLFSPFPNQWFVSGTSPGGHIKRVISGLEMLYVYFVLVGLIWAFKDEYYLPVFLEYVL